MENLNITKEYLDNLKEFNRGLEEFSLIAANEEGLINSIANFVVTGSKRIVEVLNNIAVSFSTFISFNFDKKGFNGYLADLLRFKNSFDRLANKINFSKIENISIPVTMGLEGNLKQFSDFLDTHMLILSDLSSVDELNKLLGELLSVDDIAKSRIANTVDVKTMEKIVDNLQKDLVKLVNPKSHNDKKKIKELVPSIMSIQPLIDKGIEFSKEVDIAYLEEVKEKINIVNDRVSVLVSELEAKNKEISKEKIKELTEQIRVTGNYISSAMTVFFLYTQYMAILIKIGDVMNKKA